MTSLVEPLIALGVGLILGLTGLMRPRNNTDMREQIKQDVELRGMLQEAPSADDEARAALTLSIRNNAQRLISDEPDWFTRWGFQWLFPMSLIVFFTGVNLRGTVEDFETSPGTQLALELTGQTMMLLSGPLLGLWLSRAFIPPIYDWFERRKQRKATAPSPQTD